MVTVQEGGAEKPGANEQKYRFLLGVVAHQGHGADDHGQQGANALHHRVQRGGALPVGTTQRAVAQYQANGDDPIAPGPARGR